MPKERSYIAIDLKSFYASVECVERGLNPLTTNLVVADSSRTDKTICLAVSPSLKGYGIGGRARLFEVVQRVRQVNAERALDCPDQRLTGSSYLLPELQQHPDWGIDYITAPPRMALYIQYSARIYEIYLRYIAPEDIHSYSCDEVFMDVTDYLATYHATPHELAMRIIREVLRETGITATAGIGTNLYLCKVAMDIMAKHTPADQDGVRIAQLDEKTYRQLLWDHQPITDFWRVGRGIANRLADCGIYTMGQLARYSLDKSMVLHRMFGINAELLIDHAWGWEPCTMEYIKDYRPTVNSFCNGQVLTRPYTCAEARIVLMEMAEAAALQLVDHQMMTDRLTLRIGYDTSSLADPAIHCKYHGPVSRDYYGREVPHHSEGRQRLERYTSSSTIIIDALTQLYDRVTNPLLLIRRLNITSENLICERLATYREENQAIQLDLFTDYEQVAHQKQTEREAMKKERKVQDALLNIKKRYGKNAILRGTSFADCATARERNQQIGGHKA